MTVRLKMLMQIAVSLLPGFIKIPLYRSLFDAKIGIQTQIGFGAILIFENLEIGPHCKISPFCVFRVTNLRLGDRCKVGLFTRVTTYDMSLGACVTIGPQVSILASERDPRCVFSAGAESWIFEYCYINPARPIRLGRNVGVGGGSYLFAHGLWLSKLKGYPVGFGEIEIGNDVWLPWGCFVMPGVTIGHGAVVGARALITKSIPAGALAAGMPAKIIKEQVATPLSTEAQLEILLETTQDYAQVSNTIWTHVRSDEWELLQTEGIVEIVLAWNPAQSSPNPDYPNALHVFHVPLAKLSARPTAAYSLASFQCTSRPSLNRSQAAWLQHLRQIGTRHYPLDETSVE